MWVCVLSGAERRERYLYTDDVKLQHLLSTYNAVYRSLTWLQVAGGSSRQQASFQHSNASAIIDVILYRATFLLGEVDELAIFLRCVCVCVWVRLLCCHRAVLLIPFLSFCFNFLLLFSGMRVLSLLSFSSISCYVMWCGAQLRPRAHTLIRVQVHNMRGACLMLKNAKMLALASRHRHRIRKTSTSEPK